MKSTIEFDEASNTLLTAGLVGTIPLAVLAVYFYYKNAHSFWSRQGIKGPKPLPLFGNALSILFANRLKLDNKWRQENGKVFGYYMGTTPKLMVADAEVVQQICIKDFDVFPNHELKHLANKFQNSNIFSLRDNDWKRVRALMSPTFTSGKIKRMFRFLDGCANDLVQCFQEQIPATGDKKAEVNVKNLYNLFTMDAITTCCYGLKLQREGATDLKTAASRNQFVSMANKLFEFSFPRLIIGLCVPKWILVSIGFTTTSFSKMQPLNQRVEQLIQARRDSPKKYDDYLQLLIDAKLTDKIELNEMDDAENHHAGLTQSSLIQDQEKLLRDLGKSGSKVMTDVEILANATFLLSVGLHTTGSLLSNVSYALAFHQDVQEKLYQELLKIVEYSDDKSSFAFNYDSLTSCRYLDVVLSECLRLMTPVWQIEHYTSRDYYIEKYDIHLKEGQMVSLGLNMMHSDPDYWEEPEKFNPDRFLPENKDKIVPGSYSPFGQGPRHCIGMRFSLTEAKLALAKVMMNFRFERAPDTQLPPELKASYMLYQMQRPNAIISPREAMKG